MHVHRDYEGTLQLFSVLTVGNVWENTAPRASRTFWVGGSGLPRNEIQLHLPRLSRNSWVIVN